MPRPGAPSIDRSLRGRRRSRGFATVLRRPTSFRARAVSRAELAPGHAVHRPFQAGGRRFTGQRRRRSISATRSTRPGHTARLLRTSRAGGLSRGRPRSAARRRFTGGRERCERSRGPPCGDPHVGRGHRVEESLPFFARREGGSAIEPQLDIARAPSVTDADVRTLGALVVSRRSRTHFPAPSPRREGHFGGPGCFPSSRTRAR